MGSSVRDGLCSLYENHEIDKACPIPPKGMILIPAGEFKYGPRDNSVRWSSIESLPNFFIDKYEVTAKQYKECVDAGTCKDKDFGSGDEYTYNNPEKQDHPINFVSWYGAQAYCTWKGKRLPTEKEWEKAARGVDGRVYPWGNESPTCDYAVINSAKRSEPTAPGCGTNATMPVGSKPKGNSPYGVSDLSGNVAEWTSSSKTHKNSRVYRGGSMTNRSFSASLSSSDNDLLLPTRHMAKTIGFRCAQ